MRGFQGLIRVALKHRHVKLKLEASRCVRVLEVDRCDVGQTRDASLMQKAALISANLPQCVKMWRLKQPRCWWLSTNFLSVSSLIFVA